MKNLMNGNRGCKVKALKRRDKQALVKLVGRMQLDFLDMVPQELAAIEGSKEQTVFVVSNEAAWQFSHWLRRLAFEAFLGTHYHRYLSQRLLRRAGCASTADDLAGKAIVKALRFVRSTGQIPVWPAAWLSRIAGNVLRDHERQLNRRNETALEGMEESAQLAVHRCPSEEEIARETMRMLAKRGGGRLVRLVKGRLRNLTNAELARHENVSERTIERWWERIRTLAG